MEKRLPQVIHEWSMESLLARYPPQYKPYQHAIVRTITRNFGIWHPMNMLSYVIYIYERKLEMTVKKRSRGLVKKGEYTFVRLSLNAQEKVAAKKYSEQTPEVIDKLLTDLLMSGHKVSFSYSEFNDAVTCTFTGKPDEAVNEFRMLTSFAASWWQALCINLYKHNELFSAGVWEDQSSEEDFG